MLLNVNKLLHTPDAAQDVQFTMDLSDMEFGGGYRVPARHCGRQASEQGWRPAVYAGGKYDASLRLRPLRKTLQQGQDRHLPVRAGRGTAVR